MKSRLPFSPGCQRFTFRKVTLREISNHLATLAKKEAISISAQGIALIAREARGSFRDALSLLDQVISFAGKNIDEKVIFGFNWSC